ncbi:MAG: putative ATPase [Bradymonadia bacterium]|jgi:predicted ATPase
MPSTHHAALTSFVGRVEELAKISSLLDGFRLVVVLGPGGIGKTRVAHRLLEQRTENSVFVDLADVTDASAVSRAVATALGLPPLDAAEVPELLASCGPLLLVLDNFEQLVDVAASEVHAWLQGAPELRVLVTSRRRLEFGGEVSFELPPLSIQADNANSDALTLFMERASRQRPDVQWGKLEVRTAAEAIVRRLDGIPLALELAAGQLRLMEPSELLNRLDGLLRVLGSGPRNAADRHRTVRCAIQGSWDVLGDTAKRSLAICSLFRGGFSLESADAVLANIGDPLELIAELRDRSLLRGSTVSGVTRFGLYETVRAFASDELLAEDRAAAQEKLAAWAAGQPLVSGGSMSRERIQRAALDRENLVTAFAWASLGGEAELTSEIGIRLAALYMLQGPARSALEVMTRTLEVATESGLPSATIADLHCRRGRLEVHYGELSGARSDWKSAHALAPLSSGGLRGEVAALRAAIERSAGDAATAEMAYSEALSLLREHRPEQVGRTLSNFAGFLMEQGRVAEARSTFAQSLSSLRDAGDLRMEAVTLGNLGLVEHEQGDLDTARARFERALELHLELGYRRFVGITRCDLAVLAFERRQFAEADTFFGVGREDLIAAGDFRQFALATSAHAACVARLGELERAEEIAASATKHHARVSGSPLGEAVGIYGLHRQLAGKPADSELLSAVRNLLDSDALAAATNDELRLALRLLHQALDAIDAASSALRVAEGSVELVLPGGESVSLESRPVLARLLETLVSAALAQSGSVSVETLVRSGWPDQRAVNSAAVNRLHVALSTLRKLGLKPYLQRVEDAYQLAEELRVMRTRTIDRT